jgi:hypothetical protein
MAVLWRIRASCDIDLTRSHKSRFFVVNWLIKGF